jgi:hypothetical protein
MLVVQDMGDRRGSACRSLLWFASSCSKLCRGNCCLACACHSEALPCERQIRPYCFIAKSLSSCGHEGFGP